MAQTISRKAGGVRRQGRARGAARQGRGAGSLLDRMMRLLPFTEEHMHRLFTVLILAGALALAVFVAIYAGALDMAGARLAATAADAGYEVRRVEVRGVERMNELEVYERVLGERDRAMPLLDLGALRESLLDLPYVEDARVVRQLPDSLIIDIVEREPHAALRLNDANGQGRLMLVDIGGHALEPLPRAAAAKMLVVSGEGARHRMDDLERLLDAAPELRPQVAEAEWVGNRRWNLTFRTGQNLALPQGEDRAGGALVSFARLDEVNRLIGGTVAAFDMRSPERIYLRVPGRAEEAHALEQGQGS